MEKPVAPEPGDRADADVQQRVDGQARLGLRRDRLISLQRGRLGRHGLTRCEDLATGLRSVSGP